MSRARFALGGFLILNMTVWFAAPAQAASVTGEAFCAITSGAGTNQNLTVTANLPSTITAGQSFSVSNITVKSNSANPLEGVVGASNATLTIGVSGATVSSFSKSLDFSTPAASASTTDFGTQSLTAASSGTVSLTFSTMTNHLKYISGNAWSTDFDDSTCTPLATMTITTGAISAASSGGSATTTTGASNSTTTTVVTDTTTVDTTAVDEDSTSSTGASPDLEGVEQTAASEESAGPGGIPMPALIGAFAGIVMLCGGATYFLLRRSANKAAALNKASDATPTKGFEDRVTDPYPSAPQPVPETRAERRARLATQDTDNRNLGLDHYVPQPSESPDPTPPSAPAPRQLWQPPAEQDTRS